MELDSINRGSSKEVEFFLYHRKPEIIENLENEQKIKERLYWKLLYKLINHRLNELEKTYGNHFTSSFFPPGPYLPAMELRIRSNVNTIGKGLNKVLLTLRQLKKFGLEQNEWDEFRNNYILLMDNEETDRSAYWLERIQEHFVYGEALPGNNAIDLKKWLSKLSLKEFNAALGRLISDDPDDIGIVAPKGTRFTENQVRGWIQQAQSQSVAPFIRQEVPRELLSEDQKSTLKLRGYKVIGTASSGAKEIVLDNGMKVILDTLTNSKDRFYLHGFSPNGASCFPEKAYFSAINAPYIVQNSGAGSLNKFQINSYLKEHAKGLWIRPYINYNETGIKGNAAIDDLEMMLQLIYLYFVHPREDENAFMDWKIQEENRHLYPTYGISNQDFVVRIREFLKDRSKVPEGTRRLHGIRQSEMEAAHEIYRELHGDAEDFTFIVSGSFSVEEVLPLLQKYLGNLPVRSNSISDRTRIAKEVTLPASPLYKQFNPHTMGAGYKMKNIFYYRKYLSKVDKPMHWKELIDIEVLGYMLNSRILDLRFSVEAGLYDMTAFGTINKESSFYDIGILLNVIPSELEMLRKACQSLVKELRDKVVDREVFKDVMLNNVYPKYRINKQYHPARRVEKLYDHYRFNEKWASPIEIEEYVKLLTPEDIRTSARKYLKEDNLMEFTFEDENGNSRK
jgi:predicted Zn-dependent peptidase